MVWIDLVIIAVILLAAVLGAKIGLLRALVLFGSFVIATVLGKAAAPLPASALESVIHNRDIRLVVGFTILFILILVILNIIGAIVCKVIDFTPLKWIDRGIGGILGLLAGIIFVGVVVIFMISASPSDPEEWLDKSLLMPIIKSLISPIHQGYEKNEAPEEPAESVLNIPHLFLKNKSAPPHLPGLRHVSPAWRQV